MIRNLLTGLIICMLVTQTALAAMSGAHYRNRFTVMLDYAVRTNEHVRRHLGDTKLSAYAQAMADVNAREAGQMTPPEPYAQLHHHFLIVLENAERSFYHASEGNLGRYRHHQKIFRKELNILEALAEKAGIELYYYR